MLAIPMHGGVESLNVASAGAVAAFELLRRRHPRRRAGALRVGAWLQRRIPRPAELAPLLRPAPFLRNATERRLQRAASIADLRAIARRRTPRAVFDYTDGAADGELSLRRARAAFARVEFRPDACCATCRRSTPAATCSAGGRRCRSRSRRPASPG